MVNPLGTWSRPITYHSDSSYGDESLSHVSVNSTAGPIRNVLPDYQNIAHSRGEDDILTIK